MIISRTPYRISFFGGGTDYPQYYLKHGGKVLGTAIDKFCYLNVRYLPPYFTFKHRIVYSNYENVNSIEEIQHPSVRETFKYFDVKDGKSIHHDGDIPARSGMGSSSSFTVGLINSLNALNGNISSKDELAKTAIHIEQNLIKENVGSQDQIFAAYGGLNVIEFLKNGAISVSPVIAGKDRLEQLENSLLLVFSGLSRIADKIAKTKIKNIDNNLDSLDYMKRLVDKAYDVLTDKTRDLTEFGHLLNETWRYKKTLADSVSNPLIDNIYEKALEGGATGGKLLGAGAGGFMLFYVEPHKREKLLEELKDYLVIPFKFDFDGSKIIAYEPNYNVAK